MVKDGYAQMRYDESNKTVFNLDNGYELGRLYQGENLNHQNREANSPKEPNHIEIECWIKNNLRERAMFLTDWGGM
jgi:hypothetical protein